MTSNQWQPIDTAPKDGTPVDVWSRGRRWPDAQYDPGIGAWCYWGLEDFENDVLVPIPFPVTHWMPIPEAPCE